MRSRNTKILSLVILLTLLTFAACSSKMEIDDNYEQRYIEELRLELKKYERAENFLIERLQDTIEKLDNINEASIKIDISNASEKAIEVYIDTTSDESLTDKQKTDIADLIQNNFSKEFTVTVDIKEE